MLADRVIVYPMTIERWGDLEKLFQEIPGCNMCWCMYWRKPRSDLFGNHQVNYDEMKSLVEGGHIPGIIVYLDGEPVAWCSVAPRSFFPGLDRSPTLKAVDDEPVWSITCISVSKNHRRQGLCRRIVGEAVEYAESNGARIVEAYPLINEEKKYRLPGESFMGFESTFKALGFKRVSDRSRVRNIMRLYLVNAS